MEHGAWSAVSDVSEQKRGVRAGGRGEIVCTVHRFASFLPLWLPLTSHHSHILALLLHPSPSTLHPCRPDELLADLCAADFCFCVAIDHAAGKLLEPGLDFVSLVDVVMCSKGQFWGFLLLESLLT
jgi:hypothetical protein